MEMVGSSVVPVVMEMVGSSVVPVVMEMVGSSVVPVVMEMVGSSVVPVVMEMVGSSVVPVVMEMVGCCVVPVVMEMVGSSVVPVVMELCHTCRDGDDLLAAALCPALRDRVHDVRRARRQPAELHLAIRLAALLRDALTVVVVHREHVGVEDVVERRLAVGDRHRRRRRLVGQLRQLRRDHRL